MHNLVPSAQRMSISNGRFLDKNKYAQTGKKCRNIATAPYTLKLSAAKGEERILVVDDEEMIAGLIKTLLESRGYIVTVAHNPQEAISAVNCADHPFDLAIIDYTMPSMTGDRCLTAIRQKYPNLKAILITGYGLDESSISEPNVYLVHKPFSAQSIIQEVRTMLDDS